jgi:hypothetical protein
MTRKSEGGGDDYHTISPNFQTIITFSQGDGDAMNYRTLLLSSLLLAFATMSSAQEPKGHIDLDVVSNSPLPAFVVVRVSFAEEDRCGRRKPDADSI